MSKYAYTQECQFCGKLFKFPTKLKYCSEECKEKANAYVKNLKHKNVNMTVKIAMQIHKIEMSDPKPREVKEAAGRNPFLRAGNKILFPVRYTSGAIRWEWIDVDKIEKGVMIL